MAVVSSNLAFLQQSGALLDSTVMLKVCAFTAFIAPPIIKHCIEGEHAPCTQDFVHKVPLLGQLQAEDEAGTAKKRHAKCPTTCRADV
jgi:hypothetical protein